MKKLSYEKKIKLKKAIFVNSKLIVVAAIGAIIGSLSVGYAAQIYYDGVNVGYDNTASGLTSTTVQGALDELCNVADFSDRTSTLESYFPTFTTSQNKTRNPYSGTGINLGINADTNENAWIDLYKNGTIQGAIATYSSGEGIGISGWKNGERGTGTLGLSGNPININTNGTTNSTNIYGSPVKINNLFACTSNVSSWTKSFTFNMKLGSHSLLAISGSIYLIWTAGDTSNPSINYYIIYGTEPTGFSITLSGTRTVNVSTTNNNTFTVFIGNSFE